MKIVFVFLLAVVFLTGCSSDSVQKKPDGATTDTVFETAVETAEIDSGRTDVLPAFGGVLDRRKVEAVGDIPIGFQKIVENNLFNNVYVFEDVIFSHSTTSGCHVLRAYDYEGYPLAYYSNSDVNLRLSAIAPADDGGFIFVLGNPTHYNFYLGTRIVKCDSTGKVMWESEYENADGLMLDTCIQHNGDYFFFGSYYRDSSASVDQSRREDIWVLKYSGDGRFLNRAVFGGSGFDNFVNAEIVGDEILLYCESLSEDGDFSQKGRLLVTLDLSLNTKSVVYGKESPFYFHKVGVFEGKTVYEEDFEKITVEITDSDGYSFSGFSYVDTIIDYGDFYLAVVYHVTELYENTPLEVSSNWYYSETVYSAFDKKGVLLWRGTVDSSPDFDSLLAAYKK